MCIIKNLFYAIFRPQTIRHTYPDPHIHQNPRVKRTHAYCCDSIYVRTGNKNVKHRKSAVAVAVWSSRFLTEDNEPGSGKWYSIGWQCEIMRGGKSILLHTNTHTLVIVIISFKNDSDARDWLGELGRAKM